MEETQTTLETELEVDPLVEGDRSEENRITEAEKNERQRKMLQVLMQWSMNFLNMRVPKVSVFNFFAYLYRHYISSGLIEVLVVKIRNFKIQLMDAQEN